MSAGLFGSGSSAPAACSGSGDDGLGSDSVTSIFMTDRKTTKYQLASELKK